MFPWLHYSNLSSAILLTKSVAFTKDRPISITVNAACAFLKISQIVTFGTPRPINKVVLLNTHFALRHLILFMLLLTTCSLGAQTLQGVVTDAATGKPLYLVSVLNEKTNKMATTDANGFYSIMAEQGQSIRFSCIGFKTIHRVKPPSVIISTANIDMERDESELKEFVFRSSRLSQYQLDSIERQQTYKIQLQRRPPNAVMSPASALAELFSKKAKRTYQFQKDFAEGEINKFIDTRYTAALVTKLTGITGDTIGHFMYAFPMPYDFARNATDLELKMWIRSSYKEWLKLPNRDSLMFR